jgi:hypothetical protein
VLSWRRRAAISLVASDAIGSRPLDNGATVLWDDGQYSVLVLGHSGFLARLRPKKATQLDLIICARRHESSVRLSKTHRVGCARRDSNPHARRH